MKIPKLKQFSTDIIFLVLALISFLTGRTKIALGLIVIVLIHAVIRIYLHKGRVRPCNEEKTKMFFIIIAIIYLINVFIQHFIFNKPIPLLMLSLAAVIFLALYLFYRFLIWYDPSLFKPHDKSHIETSKWNTMGLIGYFLCAISIVAIIILSVYGMITIQVVIISIVAFLAGIILIISNYISYKKS